MHILLYINSNSFYIGDQLFLQVLNVSSAASSSTLGETFAQVLKKLEIKINPPYKYSLSLVKKSAIPASLKKIPLETPEILPQARIEVKRTRKSIGRRRKSTSRRSSPHGWIYNNISAIARSIGITGNANNTHHFHEYKFKRPIRQNRDSEKILDAVYQVIQKNKIENLNTQIPLTMSELERDYFLCLVIKKSDPKLDIGVFESNQTLLENYLHNVKQTNSKPKNIILTESILDPQSCVHLMSLLDSTTPSKLDKIDVKYILNADEKKELKLEKLIPFFPPPWDEIIIRKNSSSADEEQFAIDFHRDVAKETCQIFLNASNEYDGGKTIYATDDDDSVFIPDRIQGCAIIHNNQIWHAVSPITKGVRYGLFLLKNSKIEGFV